MTALTQPIEGRVYVGKPPPSTRTLATLSGSQRAEKGKRRELTVDEKRRTQIVMTEIMEERMRIKTRIAILEGILRMLDEREEALCALL